MTPNSAPAPAPAAPRRRLRRRLLIGLAPVALVGLLVVAKILSMYAFAFGAVTSHVAGDAPATVAAAENQEPVNVFERWLAPYNVGVGLAASGDLPEARAKFEEALPLARGLDVCPVRLNLALVLEMMGDATRGSDPDAAAELYAEALEVNAGTPEECRSEEADAASPDPSRQSSQTLDDQRQRLEQQQQQQGGDEEEPPEEEAQQQQDDLDEIEEKLRESDRERQEQQGDEGGSGGGTDKPW
ncbi:hypothetical protein [Microbacterium halophytorum]|uniref:hypothetical protein n=1 Tax=Microbacterium halophytorum TaxID=2067568 RepID=UPI000CFBF7BF|nr:hypothetical protein [Microbacterium halophytorum]